MSAPPTEATIRQALDAFRAWAPEEWDLDLGNAAAAYCEAITSRRCSRWTRSVSKATSRRTPGPCGATFGRRRPGGLSRSWPTPPSGPRRPLLAVMLDELTTGALRFAGEYPEASSRSGEPVNDRQQEPRAGGPVN